MAKDITSGHGPQEGQPCDQIRDLEPGKLCGRPGGASKDVPVVLGPRSALGEPQVRDHRRDGFTPEKRDAFFAHLADSCNMAASARLVGISQTSVRNWRRKDPEFAHRYAVVIADAYADLEMRLLAMAREGVTGEQWEEVGEDGITRLRYRRDTPGQMRMLLMHHHKERGVTEAQKDPERAPRETFDELIQRLRDRLREIEAEEASGHGVAR